MLPCCLRSQRQFCVLQGAGATLAEPVPLPQPAAVAAAERTWLAAQGDAPELVQLL